MAVRGVQIQIIVSIKFEVCYCFRFVEDSSSAALLVTAAAAAEGTARPKGSLEQIREPRELKKNVFWQATAMNPHRNQELPLEGRAAAALPFEGTAVAVGLAWGRRSCQLMTRPKGARHSAARWNLAAGKAYLGAWFEGEQD